ncbi:MAG: CPBP family intramembrane glutamic endopeptidase [Acidimicrobiales bacterium]
MQYTETRTHPFSLKRAMSGYVVSSVVGAVVTVWQLIEHYDGSEELAEADVLELVLGPWLWGTTAMLGVQLLWVAWITLDHASPHQTLGLRLAAADIPIGLGLVGLVVAGNVVITRFVVPLFTETESDIGGGQFPFSSIPETQILWLIAIVGLLVPVVEEVYFRGVLLQAMEDRLGLPTALVGSSVLFGVVHLATISAEGLVAVILATWAGLVFAMATVVTGRLGAAIVAHSLNNIIVMLVVTSG